jgi:hypothetical protein
MCMPPAPQSIKVLNMVKLFGKAIRINKASQDKTNSSDVGANLFVGNLDPDVDEKVGCIYEGLRTGWRGGGGVGRCICWQGMRQVLVAWADRGDLIQQQRCGGQLLCRQPGPRRGRKGEPGGGGVKGDGCRRGCVRKH